MVCARNRDLGHNRPVKPFSFIADAVRRHERPRPRRAGPPRRIRRGHDVRDPRPPRRGHASPRSRTSRPSPPRRRRSGSRRSSTTTTCATRRSSPRTSRRSTSCPTAGSTSPSAPAGTSPSTTRSASPSTPSRPARPGSSEAVAVIKGCFGEGPFSFHGEFYDISDYQGFPRPAQRPHPPIFIGGGGRRTLSLAGREANIVGLAPRILKEQRAEPKSLTWAAAEEKVDWVREAAGDRFDDLVFNVYPSGSPIVVTDDLRGEARKIIDRLKSRTGIELTEQEVIDSPHVYIGSIDRFVEKFRELRERLGVSSFLVGDLTELGPVVERLAGT